jgi:recombination protein RecA
LFIFVAGFIQNFLTPEEHLARKVIGNQQKYTHISHLLTRSQPMADDRENKLKTLQSTIDRLDKTYGKGTIMRLGDKQAVEVEVIPTGSLGLDMALGCYGIPKGRIIEIYGPEASGKTTLAIHMVAECQKKGGIAAIVDAEHAFDRFYAEALGVNVNDLLISQPDNGEQALEIAENLIRSGAVDILVIDSVAALVPRAEIEGEMGDSKMGLQARLMSQAMRKMTANIGRTGCCCIFINQLREKIGVMFGNPETTTGGNALKFYASVRLDIRKSGAALKDKDGNVVGNQVKVKVVKNKLAPPFRIAQFDIIFGEGISKAGEIVDIGSDFDIIQKSGAWYSYSGAKIAQGRDAAKQFMLDNPEVAAEIEQKVKEKAAAGPVKQGAAGAAVAVAAGDDGEDDF